jgi:hypothetical protein
MTPPMRRAARALVLVLLLAARPALPRELWRAGERSVELRTSVKSTLLLTRAPEDPLLYPERDNAETLWRVRFEAEAKPGRSTAWLLAYEHRARTAMRSGGLPSGALPEEAPAPYRVRQLDWAILDPPGIGWRHEIDRARVAFHPAGAEVTLGRQAVGWGRGALFGAVDLFAPFSPLEADREWRRGLDAAHVDLRFSDRLSADVVAAFADRLDESVAAARARGYAGKLDGELIVGSRARDFCVGATSSIGVGGAEVHGEVACFRAPDPVPGSGRDVAKAVLGGSYRLPIGNGLPLIVEYHYSGFGIPAARDVLARLSEPDYARRVLRGDTQILGRHAAGLLATYQASAELSAGVTALVSPADGSGVVLPEATVELGDRVGVRAIVYLPWGAGPRGGRLGSFYGATPLTGFLQIRFDD